MIDIIKNITEKINNQALVVMARVPEVGRVKTRLIPSIGASVVCNLYKCLLEDLFFRIKELKNIDVYVFYTPEELTGELSNLVPEGFLLLPQKGGDLGERMYNATDHLIDKGYERVTIIGSDSPDIPLDYITEAFLKLENAKEDKVVVGPSTDGGYYLISVNCKTKVPFTSMEWGGPTVFDSTINKLSEAAVKYDLLPEWYDIDVEEDLKYLKNNKNTPKSSKFLETLLIK